MIEGGQTGKTDKVNREWNKKAKQRIESQLRKKDISLSYIYNEDMK